VAAEVVPEGAEDAEEVDPAMRFEILVLNGDDGLAQHWGKVVEVDDHAALQREGTDDVALLVVEVGHGGWPVAFEVVHLREIGGVDQEQTGE
jgi:hypothetical protein